MGLVNQIKKVLNGPPKDTEMQIDSGSKVEPPAKIQKTKSMQEKLQEMGSQK